MSEPTSPQISSTSTISAPPLPPIRRFITTHTFDGKAVIISPALQVCDPSNPSQCHLASKPMAGLYSATTTPACNAPSTLNIALTAADAGRFNHPGGTSFRSFDMAPGTMHDMHRTVSLDYFVVVSGEVDLEVDDGVKEVLRAGDTVVIRGTMHKWVNRGREWVRIVAVVVDAEKVVTKRGVLDWNVGKIAVDAQKRK